MMWILQQVVGNRKRSTHYSYNTEMCWTTVITAVFNLNITNKAVNKIANVKYKTSQDWVEIEVKGVGGQVKIEAKCNQDQVKAEIKTFQNPAFTQISSIIK